MAPGPYRASRGGCLRQGEILARVAQWTVVPASLRSEGGSRRDDADRFRQPADITEHDWAVILSQDCDLEWDYATRFPHRTRARPRQPKELPNVLLCEARAVPTGVRLPDYPGDIWRRIENSQDGRYQLLPEVAPSSDSGRSGVPRLLVDFKRYFTIPSAELYQRLALRTGNRERAERRAQMLSPYRESFALRFFNYQARVALPEESP